MLHTNSSTSEYSNKTDSTKSVLNECVQLPPMPMWIDTDPDWFDKLQTSTMWKLHELKMDFNNVDNIMKGCNSSDVAKRIPIVEPTVAPPVWLMRPGAFK